MVYLGCSGFSYDDWQGPFYPKGLSSRDRLSFYAQHFRATEVNSTYYRVMSPQSVAAMARKVPEGFLFTVKANKAMTHEIGEDNRATFEAFHRSLKPLADSGKLGCVLAQFPYSFRKVPEHWDYVLTLGERLEGVPVVVEFRNREWIREEVFTALQSHNLGFCCVDEPQFGKLVPPVVRVTGDLAYLRFHGRNYEKWWQHEQAWERYNYLYREEELAEWVPRVQSLAAKASKTFVFFNNHYQGQAVINSQQFKTLLELSDSPAK